MVVVGEFDAVRGGDDGDGVIMVVLVLRVKPGNTDAKGSGAARQRRCSRRH